MILKCDFEMCFRMVRTRQGARTDPSPVRGSDQSFCNESDPDWDPLANTSSHIPATSVYSERGESVRLRDDSLSRQADVSIPEVLDRQGGDNIPPTSGTGSWVKLIFKSCFYGTYSESCSSRNGSESLQYSS
jgi:hypothetical protein